MGTTSSFFGGGGGGGDPQANFQAGSNVSNGELVVLNSNGTIAPVESNSIAADFTLSNDGTKVATEGTRNYSTTGKWGIYNSSLDSYVFAISWDGNNYQTIYKATYSDVTNEYTLTFRGQFAGLASRLSDKFSPSNGVLYAYIGTNNYMYVRGFYGSNYSLGSEATFASGYMFSSACYCNANGEGSSDFTVAGLHDGYLSVVPGTWDGSSSAPTVVDDLSTNARRFTSEGNSWASNGFAGVHVKDKVHVFSLVKSNNVLYLAAAKCEAASTTFGAITNTTESVNSNYKSMAYDPVKNIGLVLYYNSSSTLAAKPFSVDVNSLAVTTYPDISVIGLTNKASVTFSPDANKFCIVDAHSTVRDAEVFKLSSSGAKSDTTTHTIAPALSGNPQFEFNSQFPITGTNKIGLIFNAGGQFAGTYVTNSNHSYATEFQIASVNSNVDSYFGQAKEAITSGSAGPVGIIERAADISNASFATGEKLFANPSGSSLATSGTYQVGYASDADTVIVTGDPS